MDHIRFIDFHDNLRPCSFPADNIHSIPIWDCSWTISCLLYISNRLPFIDCIFSNTRRLWITPMTTHYQNWRSSAYYCISIKAEFWFRASVRPPQQLHWYFVINQPGTKRELSFGCPRIGADIKYFKFIWWPPANCNHFIVEIPNRNVFVIVDRVRMIYISFSIVTFIIDYINDYVSQ